MAFCGQQLWLTKCSLRETSRWQTSWSSCRNCSCVFFLLGNNHIEFQIEINLKGIPVFNAMQHLTWLKPFFHTIVKNQENSLVSFKDLNVETKVSDIFRWAISTWFNLTKSSEHLAENKNVGQPSDEINSNNDDDNDKKNSNHYSSYETSIWTRSTTCWSSGWKKSTQLFVLFRKMCELWLQGKFLFWNRHLPNWVLCFVER